MSSREPSSRAFGSDAAAHVLLGTGALAVLAALVFLATAIGGGSSSGDAGEEGGDGTLGGRPVTSSLAGVTSRFALAITASGQPGPPVVVVAVGDEQVCSVLLGDAARFWVDADVEWSRAGVPLENGTTAVRVSDGESLASSCYRPSAGLEVGVHTVRWTAGDQEVIDAVVVGDPASTGLVEIHNAGDAIVCTLRISPGDLSTSSNDLPGVLERNRRTRLELSIGPHRFEAEDCAGEPVGEGQITVGSQVTLIVVGGSVGAEAEPPPLVQPDDAPGAEDVDVVVESGPVALGPVWTTGVDDAGVPVDALAFIGPENERNFCLSWAYRNVPAGSAFELVWSVDGVTGPGDVSSGTTSPPVDGNFWGCYGNPDGLPDGRYEAEWRIDGVAVFSESITVGPLATTSLEIRNRSTTAICSVRMSESGASTSGLDQLDQELAPDASVRFDVATSPQDISIEDCSGRVLWAARDLVVPAGGVISVTA